MTRTVSAHLFCAVNGVVESPDRFQFDSFGPEEGELMGRSLFLAGVVDRLTLTVHPAIGRGRRLFDETVPVTRLRLVDHAVTSCGNAVLTYSLRQ